MAIHNDGSVDGGGEGSPSPMMSILAGRMMEMLATRDRERAEDAALQDREREPPEDAALQSEADLTKDIENDLTKKTEGTDLTEQETTQ